MKGNQFLLRALWNVGYFVHFTLPQQGDQPGVDCSKGGIPSIESGISRPTLSPENPVLTAKDITDFGLVEFVADPFLFVESERYHMFFEISNTTRTPDAVIGHATSQDGFQWEYDRVVLNTGYHVSFPYVFEDCGGRFLLPEDGRPAGVNEVKLFSADPFPNQWEEHTTLLRPSFDACDPVVFPWKDEWWLLVADGANFDLHLYHAHTITGNWTEHPESPIVREDASHSRPAGRPIVHNDGVIIFLQDCSSIYGQKVRQFNLRSLTRDSVELAECTTSPILVPSSTRFGWNSGRMHHLDAQLVDDGWLVAVDGNVDFGTNVVSSRHWSIGVGRS